MGVNFYEMAVLLIGDLPITFHFIYGIGTILLILMTFGVIFLPIYFISKIIGGRM